MKVTINVPDELYRKVKAKTAAQGRRVRDVSIELYDRWVNEGRSQDSEQSAEQWLHHWFSLADAQTVAQPGPIARDILAQDRSRLDTK